MNSLGGTKSKLNPASILGNMGFFDESDSEKENSVFSAITSAVTSVASVVRDTAVEGYKATSELSQTVIVTESQLESGASGKFSTTGSFEDFNKNKAQLEQLQKQQTEREKAAQKRIFFQALKEDQDRAQKSKEKLLFEEEINDIVTNLPTDQKNQLLHYQASYKDRSIYQRAELRKKLIEQRKEEEKKQQQASLSVTNPAGQVVKEGDLINKEGGSKYGGVGDTGGVG